MAHPEHNDTKLGPALHILRHVWRLNHVAERLSGQMEKNLGVTAQQRLVIRCIGKFPGIGGGALAALLFLDPGTVSATLNRLEAKKLLKRERDPLDLRRTVLTLTARGRALDAPTAGTVESAIQQLIDATPAEDIATTTRVLTALADIIDRQVASKPADTRSPSAM